jgi:glycosyltransferase involved in cell wall biosynthesis
MLDSLKKQSLNCILVDDGSRNECRQRLQSIASSHTWITLLTRPENGGKGAAVCEGLQYAFQQGFSHALQVDADNQHNLDDIPHFIQMAKLHPHAVVTGVRLYTSVPKSRRYGRIITDVWVWINTLSLTISDSMCGYRLYPLRETMELLSTTSVGQRMDFDTDIIVRLYWQGLAIKEISSTVLYHPSIESHFDLCKDNLRISKMHARLFFGMLYRLPTLLLRNCRKLFNEHKKQQLEN